VKRLAIATLVVITLGIVALGTTLIWFPRLLPDLDGDRRWDMASPVEAVTRLRLVAAVETPGTDPDPWLLAHALIALDWREDGVPLRDSWVERLDRRWILRTAGRGASVPLVTETGRGEQHPHLVMKNLAEVAAEHGHERSRELAHTLARDAVSFFIPPTDYRSWNDVAWLLHGVALLSREPNSPYRAETPLGAGAMTLGTLALGALVEVENADRVVEDALAAETGFTRPSADEPPVRAGIYAFTCGGQHLLQGVIAAALAGWIPPSELPRVERRVDVLIRRLVAEEEFRRVEEWHALADGVSTIRAARARVRASLKLHGHGLETLALAHSAFPTLRGQVENALKRETPIVVALLERRETVLDPEGTIAPRMRNEEPLEWELWFGDGAHALHGLAGARAAFGEPYDD